jgi:EAL domain-containing protein (putative c-di-GMP-specific phosphodiesterase class I)
MTNNTRDQNLSATQLYSSLLDNHDCEGPYYLRSAYGDEAAAILSHLSSVYQLLDDSVERFYQILTSIPAATVILINLTADEFKHLKVAQTRYLQTILSPSLTAKQHREMAVKAGLRHSHVGVSTEVLTESFGLYKDIIYGLTSECSTCPERLREIVTQRFQYDMITQIEVYAWVQKHRFDSYQRIEALEHTHNPLDFVQQSLEILVDAFKDDVLGIGFGAVRNGNFRYLFANGVLPFTGEHQLKPDYKTFVIPEIQQAWFDESALLLNTFNNESISEPLRHACDDLNIRSLGVFIMHDLHNAPKGCLIMANRYPGYFIDKRTQHYWQQIADLIGGGLEVMERSGERRKHRLADGLHFRQLLQQQKVEMYYQPIIDPVSGRTVKVEALARLKDNDRIIAPGLFLSAFGSSQLRDLFDVGLLQIIGNIKNTDLPPCSINVPPEALSDIAWLNRLPVHLANMGATPECISLEILESALSDDKQVKSALHTLKEAGYSILLDDVGAGESSLLRLATLPVSGIKIDQSFVRSLQHNFEYLDFILTLRSLAAQRGLKCVAEGVETDAIVDTLGSVNGLQFQGYALARPMPGLALRSWMSRAEEGMPLGPFPRSLYGWYCRHVDRFISIRNGLDVISDLISIDFLKDAERCPLHSIIPMIGGDKQIEEAHRQWHANYARFTQMVQNGTRPSELWQAMEICKLELRSLIENKLSADAKSEL